MSIFSGVSQELYHCASYIWACLSLKSGSECDTRSRSNVYIPVGGAVSPEQSVDDPVLPTQLYCMAFAVTKVQCRFGSD